MSNASLSAAEKAKAMQDLMTSEWRAKFENPTPAPPAAALTDEDRKPSYHVAPTPDKPGILGAQLPSCSRHAFCRAYSSFFFSLRRVIFAPIMPLVRAFASPRHTFSFSILFARQARLFLAHMVHSAI